MEDLTLTARAACKQFGETFEPLRPELYRFCRHLTRSPWDAEDLVQDTMSRALVQLGRLLQPKLDNPRSWLFRVATNLWIDHVRRAHELLGDVPEGAVSSDPRATREAAGTLLGRLSPQERVSVVLKDALGLSLEEVANALSTTPGAVKAALHRGRAKLAEPDPPEHHAKLPRPAALDAFCDAFNARDVASLTALLLDTVTVEMPGVALDLDRATTLDPTSGILYHTLLSSLFAGVPAAHLASYRPEVPPRSEVREYRGESVLLLWYSHTDGEAVRVVMRFELSDGLVSRLREYFFSPELLAEICGDLHVAFHTNGHGHA